MRDDRKTGAAARRAFTLVELLVVVAVVAVLMSLLAPGLAAARGRARQAVCGSNVRQMGAGLAMYAGEARGAAMPLAYTSPAIVGGGAPVYWWGTNESGGVDHTRGFLWTYLREAPRPRSVFECPDQPWGSYVPQGAAQVVTSTYGYNGYFLCPPHTPGWSVTIGRRPWQNMDVLRLPQRTLAFADAALDFGQELPQNTALLDPPWLFNGRRWMANVSPTTSFRHAGRTTGVFADGHAESPGPRGGRVTSSRFRIGSIGSENDPYYVPDWREW